jgi:hypothetical protein
LCRACVCALGAAPSSSRTDDELIANAEEHINRNHPEMVGQVSRADLLGMAEEA